MINTKNNLFLAPLDNVNCSAFRILCKENGAGLVSTPMINTNSYINNREEFYWYETEMPLMVQFIGNNPEEFKECVKNVKNCSVVDLNAGCPSPDQCKNKSGAALLKDLPLLKKIIKTMVKYSPVPVSVKTRMGWEEDNSVKIGELVQDCGAEFLTIHARTRFMGYGTPADWKVIKKIKKALSIPVIASGDLLNPKNIKDCLDLTNCNGVMIARGAINNPFIFNDSLHYLKTGELITHSKLERLELIERFIQLYQEYDTFNLSELRNHCAWLVKEFHGARNLRDKIGKCQDEKSIKRLIKAEKFL